MSLVHVLCSKLQMCLCVRTTSKSAERRKPTPRTYTRITTSTTRMAIRCFQLKLECFEFFVPKSWSDIRCYTLQFLSVMKRPPCYTSSVICLCVESSQASICNDRFLCWYLYLSCSVTTQGLLCLSSFLQLRHFTFPCISTLHKTPVVTTCFL